MNDLKRSNIVPMGGYDSEKSSEAESRLMEQCRERALKALQDSLSDMLDSADDMLFEMADKAENNAQQSLYFDAMREIRLARKDAEVAYLSRLQESFTESMAGKPASAAARQADTQTGGLSLLGQEQLEEDLAITNMVTKARNSAHSALFALDRRMGALLHDPDLAKHRNPLSPDIICDAFREACRKIDTSLEVRLLILKLFDQYISRDLPAIYADINEYLIGRSILPVIDADYKAVSTVRRQREMQRRSSPSAATRVTADESANSDTNADFSHLLRLLGGSLSAGSGLPMVGNTSQVIADLDNLQHQPSSLPGTSGSAPGLVAPNVLHTIRQQGLVNGMSRADDQTIDLVAILFDYILDDADIPDPMKALIGRLQIPVLKVAILDKTVFSHKEHPARRLLNTLSSAALGWNEDDDDSDALHTCIEDLIQRINREFVDDISLFDVVEKELAEFLQQQRRQADIRAERAAKVLQGQERLKLARQVAEDLVNEVLEDVELPEFVSHFMWRHMQEYLRTQHVRKGPESEEWQQSCKLFRDLVWSCQDKAGPAERKTLVAMLPGLIKSLNACMDTTAMDIRERQQFLEQLADLHGRHVRPPVLQEVSDPLERTLPPDAVTVIDASGETAASIGRTDPGVALQPQRESVDEDAMDDSHNPQPDTVPIDSCAAVDADYVSDSIRDLSVDELPTLETDMETAFESSVSREELLALFGTDQVELEEITIENELHAHAAVGADEDASLADKRGPVEAESGNELEEMPYLEQVRSLNVGDWLEFSLLGGKAQRVRLTWISQSTGVYLFTDRQGRKAAEKTEQGMVVEFRRGSVRRIENAPLFDRALSGLMERLSGKSQRSPYHPPPGLN